MRNVGMCKGLCLQEGEQLGEKQLPPRLGLAVPSELLVLSHLLTFPLIIWNDLDTVNNSHGIVPALMWVSVMRKQRLVWGPKVCVVWDTIILSGFRALFLDGSVPVAAATLFSQVLLVLAENRSIWDWDVRMSLRRQMECSRFAFSSFGPP